MVVRDDCVVLTLTKQTRPQESSEVTSSNSQVGFEGFVAIPVWVNYMVNPLNL